MPSTPGERHFLLRADVERAADICTMAIEDAWASIESAGVQITAEQLEELTVAAVRSLARRRRVRPRILGAPYQPSDLRLQREIGRRLTTTREEAERRANPQPVVPPEDPPHNTRTCCKSLSALVSCFPPPPSGEGT